MVPFEQDEKEALLVMLGLCLLIAGGPHHGSWGSAVGMDDEMGDAGVREGSSDE
jgi:hypothetical protein